MTDRAQFEAMLEALINEDQEQAQEIFHNIVVAKSREIYEELLAEDFDIAEKHDEEDEDDGLTDGYEDGEEEAMEAADDEEDAEEPADDEEGEEDAPDFGDEEGGEEDLEDRVMDLEDALEELKAEFEELMAGEEGEEGGDDMGMDDMGDDMGGDELEFEDDGMEMPAMEDEFEQPVMEYVNKVSLPKHGDNGTNTKSIVAKPNKMGGTSANIAKSFSTEKGGTQGGLAKPTTSVQDAGNINKPGANAGKTAFKKKEAGHGAEKKGQGEKADNRTSILRQAKK